MLLGYNKNGEIKFFFTDDNYLKNKFPNNSAKISNFWKYNHGLKELFTNDFKDFKNIHLYKVVNKKIKKKTDKELKEQKDELKMTKKGNIQSSLISNGKSFGRVKKILDIEESG